MKLRWMVSAVVAVVAIEGAARADSGESESAALYVEATKAASAKDYVTCIAKAEGAWSNFHHAQILGIQGLCETELGKYREGATHLAAYVKNATSDVEAPMTAAFAKAKEHVAEINVLCKPDDADLALDGKPLGKGSQVIYLDPGPHTLVATARSGMASTKQHDAVAGTHIELAIEVAVGAPPSTARPIWPGALGLSLAGGAVVVGLATLIVSFQSSADANTANSKLGTTCAFASPSPACRDAFDAESKATTIANVSVSSFITAGVLAGASIPYLVWAAGGSKDEARTGLIVLPLVSPQFQGASLFTSF